MLTIFWRTINDRRTVLLIYLVAAVAFLLMYVPIFPAFRDQQAQFDQVMKSMPEGFSKAFNLQEFNLGVFENYISTEEYSFVWPLLVLILSISLAGQFFADEIYRGTIEFLLSQPISRGRLFLARYFAGLSLIFLFVIISVFATIPIAKIFSIAVKSSHYPALALIGFLFAWAVYSIATLLSTLFSDKGKVYFITSAILVLMYVLNILSGLKSSLENLKFYSFFHYYNPPDALVRNNISTTGIWVFLAVSIVCTVLGYLIFRKRDIAA